MAVGERIVNGIGGAAQDGLGWGLKGLLGVAIAGALVGTLAISVFTTGIAALAVGAIVGAGVAEFYAGSLIGVTGALLGTVKGAATGLMKTSSPTPTYQQELNIEQLRSADLAERARIASSYDNQMARNDHAAKIAAATQAQQASPSVSTPS